MKFEDSFQYIGDVGPYQVCLAVLLGLTNLNNGIHNLAANFLLAPQDHWCHVGRLARFPHDIQRAVAIPYDSNNHGDGDVIYDSCRMFDLDYENLTDDEILTWNRSLNLDPDTATVECWDWVFDQSEFISTIISDFRLVCGKAWLAQLSSTIFIAGVLIGGLVSGVLSDRFGRHRVLTLSVLGFFAAGVAVAFAPNYYVFCALRFLVGMFDMCVTLSSTVIVLEFVGPKYRVPFAITNSATFSFGIMLVSGIAYNIRRWDRLMLVLVVPVAAMTSFIWLVPESPRWLIARGRCEEADRIIRRAAAVNGNQIPKGIKWSVEEERTDHAPGATPTAKSNLISLCKNVTLRKEMLIIYFDWFAAATVFYGMSYSAGTYGDVILNTFLSGLAELPGSMSCALCLHFAGRKFPNVIALLLSGLVCLAIALVVGVRPHMTGLITGMGTFGKAAATFAYDAALMYSMELFPTPSRHTVLGYAATVSRVGAMISPFLGGTLYAVWQPLPSVVFGSLLTATALLASCLPETKGHKLPDTLQEAVTIGMTKSESKASILSKRRNSSVYSIDSWLPEATPGDNGGNQGENNGDGFDKAEGIESLSYNHIDIHI